MSKRARGKASQPTASAFVQGEWLRRLEAEYRSAAITHQLTHWLIQIGAPPALIREGLRIVADELAHAELSERVHRAAGGAGAPAIARDTLALARSGAELEHDVAFVALQSFCLGETAAVRLFKRLRAHCTVPVARAALDRVLRDEVRHRDFGWKLLAWLLTLPGAPALRSAAFAALPAMIANLRAGYGGAEDPSAPPRAMPAGDLRWGLMPSHEYRAAVALCIERDLRPRFARLSIELAGQ
jgi:hypothetical protein